jgi:hypothetical protein
MKKIILALIGSSLILVSAGSIASDKTSLKNKWTCSTNASSSDIASDKAADKRMSTNATSASKAVAFAQKNCRDCTKITCEVQK